MIKVEPSDCIEDLKFPLRILNVLKDKGIDTVRDLVEADENGLLADDITLWSYLNKIVLVCNNTIGNDMDGFAETIGGFLIKTKTSEKYIAILKEYYNNYGSISIHVLANKYRIDEEQIRRIIIDETKRIETAVIEDEVGKKTLKIIEDAAIKRKRIDYLIIDDPIFTRLGVVHLITSFERGEFEILSDSRLKGEWLVRKIDNAEKSFSALYDGLRIMSKPVPIAYIKDMYNVNEDMLVNIKGVVVRDGYVAFGILKKLFENESNQIRLGREEISRMRCEAERLDDDKPFTLLKDLHEFIKTHYNKEIEFRYKTNRSRSDKRWRRVRVAGQDEDFLFTTDYYSSGRRIIYSKEKIVEFREVDE